MQHTEKLYLVPKHQMDRLRNAPPRENINTSVEENLDSSIREILQRHDLGPHEKAKLYTHMLQRFLSVSKHNDVESNTLTLTVPSQDGENEEAPVTEDVIVSEVLNNVPQRSLKNVKYILDKMSKAKQLSSWTDAGEFVYKGKIIAGSHMLDLLKSVTMPQTIHDKRRPTGWNEFLEAFSSLNIPHSTISNHHVKCLIDSLKRKTTGNSFEDVPRRSLKKRRHRNTPPRPSSDTSDKSPKLDAKQWLDF